MTTPNEVTIYSSGIADFRRVFALAAGTPREVTLAVKKPHVADVLASLNIYGDATLAAPPTFAPENENQGSLALDPSKAIEHLAAQLCGARVRVERAAGPPLTGTLLGLHTESEATAGNPSTVKFVAVLTEGGIAKLPIREVSRLAFEDEAVRQELTKSLRRQAETLKPDSTQIRLALVAESAEAEAVVQYTVPAAAWKISYRLREIEDGKFTLQGLAVVDNNTDEDWNDFLISVVTGEPISFATDLAEAKTPRRGRVNVVQEEALGAVEVEEAGQVVLSGAIARLAAPTAGGAAAEAEAVDLATRGKLRKLARNVMGTALQLTETTRGPSQMKPEAETHEVGDYCLYRCQRPVSIGANRSAIIPVFETELADARFVLYYKREQHAERPYRAIKLINPGPQSLGRGVCTVFQGGIYGGHCVVPATKPGEDRLLPFALETGVKVTHELGTYETRTAQVQIREGVCWQTKLTVRETLYRLRSTRDEAFTVVIDHPHLAKRSKAKITLERPDRREPLAMAGTLPEGFRLELPLAAKEQLTIRVVESKTERTKIELGDATDIPRLQAMFEQAEGPLLKNLAFQKCLDWQRQVQAKRDEISRANEQVKSLGGRQERLRKNLGVAGNDEQSVRWRTELGEVETRITELEENRLPRLERERGELETQLREALKAVVLEWTFAGTAEEELLSAEQAHSSSP